MESIAKIVGAVLAAIVAVILLKYLVLLCVNLLGFLGVFGLNLTEFAANGIGIPKWTGWFVIWSVLGAVGAFFIAHRILPRNEVPPAHFPEKAVMLAEAVRLILVILALVVFFLSSLEAAGASSICVVPYSNGCKG